MLTVYQLVFSIVFLLGIPILLGAFFQRFMEESLFALGISYVLGLFSMLALFQLIYIPFVLTNQNFLPPFWIWLCLILVGGVASALYNRHWFLKQATALKQNFRPFPLILVVALLLIAAQVFLVTFFQHTDWDDSFYVATSVTTWQTDTMFLYHPYFGDEYAYFPTRYALSGYVLFCAALSKAIGVHPAILMHSILPFFLIIVAYLVYALVGARLFSGNREKTGWFLVFMSLLNLFGNTSVYTSSSFLLLRIWQGKAILGTICIPLLFWFMMQVQKQKDKTIHWVALLVVVLSACAFSSMGVMLAPLFLGCFSLTFAVMQKNIKILLKTFFCLAPCFVYGILYVLLR